jgi:hypothetical protein
LKRTHPTWLLLGLFPCLVLGTAAAGWVVVSRLTMLYGAHQLVEAHPAVAAPPVPLDVAPQLCQGPRLTAMGWDVVTLLGATPERTTVNEAGATAIYPDRREITVTRPKNPSFDQTLAILRHTPAELDALGGQTALHAAWLGLQAKAALLDDATGAFVIDAPNLKAIQLGNPDADDPEVALDVYFKAPATTAAAAVAEPVRITMTTNHADPVLVKTQIACILSTLQRHKAL